MPRLVILSVLLITTTLGGVPPAHPEAPVRAVGPSFVPWKCPGGLPKTRDIDCGYVVVPQDRSKPHGSTIKVMAAVVRASTENPAKDPIVFLDGGPSFGAIAPFAMASYFRGWAFARDRDIILVDTRGTGFSKPALTCPELDEAEVEAFYSRPTLNAQSPRIYRRALTACWQRLVNRGIDPRAFNSAESAADLDALRRALGVKRWNVFAVSADGVLGAAYAERFPDHIRTLVFDSSMAPRASWGPDFDRGMYLMLDKIFHGCWANAACRATYPHVKRRFYRQIRRLREHPVLIRLPDFKPRPVVLKLDGVGFFVDAVNEIYPGDLFGTPSLLLNPLDYIWRISHGEVKDVYRELLGRGPVTNPHTNDFLAQGKTMSYACHELLPTRRELRRAARELPALAPRYLGSDYDLGLGFITIVSPAGCRYWPVRRLVSSRREVLNSDIPSLVLAGEYDTGMMPYVVRKLRRGLTNHHFYKMPASGHLQLAKFTNGHTCARKIAAAFLTDPSATPDSSCIASLPVADFTPASAERHSSVPAGPRSRPMVSPSRW